MHVDKMMKEEVRSIRTMNYSPSVRTDGQSSISPRNNNIKKTLNGFKMIHQEEISNMSQKFDRYKSTKNVTNAIKINLIGAESSKENSLKSGNNTHKNENILKSINNSNFSLEVRKTDRIANSPNLLADPFVGSK